MESSLRSRARIRSVTLVLTDNYFDMNGGEKIVEIIEGNTEDLRIRSVYDIR